LSETGGSCRRREGVKGRRALTKRAKGDELAFKGIEEGRASFLEVKTGDPELETKEITVRLSRWKEARGIALLQSKARVSERKALKRGEKREGVPKRGGGEESATDWGRSAASSLCLSRGSARL